MCIDVEYAMAINAFCVLAVVTLCYLYSSDRINIEVEESGTTQLDNNPPYPTSIDEWDDLPLEVRKELGGYGVWSGGVLTYVMPSTEWFAYFDEMEVYDDGEA